MLLVFNPYLDRNCITDCDRKAAELVIYAEAGTYVRCPNSMKRVKQENIFDDMRSSNSIIIYLSFLTKDAEIHSQ